MKRFLSKASVLVVSSLALVGLLSGCHDEDKHANKPVATVVKPQPKPKPFVFVINSGTSYVQSNGHNRYALSIPVSSMKQVIAFAPAQQSSPDYMTGSSISQAFPVFVKYNQDYMNGVISSRQLLPRFVHFIDESYNGHVVTYHLQSSLPFNQSSIRHITITFSKAGTH
jgi:hypothetical protein